MAEPIAEVGFLAGVCGHDGTDWIKALIDADGHLQIDGISLALPSGAATAANQVTMITALQLIDDLRAALNSVGTDELDIVFDGQNADVEITQTTPADLVVAQHQYTGAAWVKSNLIFGYHDRHPESDSETSVGDTYTSINLTAVASGEIWVIQHAGVHHNDAVARSSFIESVCGSEVIPLAHEASLDGLVRKFWQGQLVMKEDDYIRGRIVGLATDKVVYAYVQGYKMDIGM